jgi:hypothetical protein
LESVESVDGVFTLQEDFPSTGWLTLVVDSGSTGKTVFFPAHGPVSPHQMEILLKGPVIVDFGPPMPELAWINGKQIQDTRFIAQEFVRLLNAPSYPSTISLFKQSPHFNRDRLYYSVGQLIFENFEQDKIPTGFPNQFVKEVKKDLGMPQGSVTTTESVLAILTRLSFSGIEELEQTPLVKWMLRTALAAFKSPINLSVSPPHDMAACLTLLFLAGILAKDEVKPSVSFGWFTPNGKNQLQFLAVYISISK